jgi:Transcription factor WhiB
VIATTPWPTATLPVTTLVAPPEWAEDVACAELELDVVDSMFFPSRGQSGKAPRALCATCPVRAECLDYAVVAGEEFGIWGGSSERERRRLKRCRNIHGWRRAGGPPISFLPVPLLSRQVARMGARSSHPLPSVAHIREGAEPGVPIGE